MGWFEDAAANAGIDTGAAYHRQQAREREQQQQQQQQQQQATKPLGDNGHFIGYGIVFFLVVLTVYLYKRELKKPADNPPPAPPKEEQKQDIKVSRETIPLPSISKEKFFLKEGFLAPRYYTERYIRSMSWRYFEEFIESLFIYNGFSTQLTPPANDEGKDVIAWKDGTTFFIECKHWSADAIIGREYLQKLIGAAISHSVYHVVFIATCQYNENAIEYANLINRESPMTIELWDINDILNISVR